MKLVFKESSHNDWEEVAYETLYFADGREHLPIYGKSFGDNVMVHITPEEEDGELIWTVYYSPDFGNAGFKFAETGFYNSDDAIDYVYKYLLKRLDGLSENINIRKGLKESPDSKARYEIAENIASWVFGSPNMNDIDDNIDFLVNRFLKGSTLTDRIYMCDTYEELADVLSNCSLKLLMTIERGLCIDEDSIGYETDYIRKMYGESKKRLREQDVEIEVKHEGILEVPEGKNVDDLPVSHFVNLAKKKGLSKITKALNNLQVWNKNDDPKLSKWAGNMIDKVSKKMEKNEAFDRYNSNIEANFMEPGNLYNDMPGTENTQDDVFEFYVSYCMNNCRNESIAREYLESENLPDAFIDSIIDEIYRRFDISESLKEADYAGFDDPFDYQIWNQVYVPIEDKDLFIDGIYELGLDWKLGHKDRTTGRIGLKIFADQSEMEQLADIVDSYKGLVSECIIKENNKRSYWFYSLDDSFLNKIWNSERGIFTDKNVKNIKIFSSPNKEGCYVKNNSPVSSYEYPYKEFYGTKEEAYIALKDELNVALAEERNDL